MSKFCGNCGSQIDDQAKVCPNCGAPVEDNASTDSESAQPSNAVSNSNSLFYAGIGIALLNAILPFFKWIKIPILNNLGSWLGMGNDASSFSLFSYIANGGEEMIFVVPIAAISVILNIIYVISGLFRKKKSTKLGTTAAYISLIMSILFLIIAGYSQLILKVITMTPAVYISIAASIAEIVIMRKIKKGN